MKEWLEETNEEGEKLYKTLGWPSLADSPTQQEYTQSKAFDANAFGGNGISQIVFKNNGEVTAKQLKDFDEKEFELFKEKFGKTIPSNEHKLLALKDWKLQNGFLIIIPENANAEITIESKAQEGVVGLHNIVVLEKGAKAKIYEKQEGKNVLQASATEVFLSRESELNFDFTQNLGLESVDFGIKRAELSENARLVWNTSFIGGKTSIATIDSKLLGQGAKAENYNSFFGLKNQVFDVSTNSFHFVPNTGGNLLSKGVLTGESQSTYRGLIYINAKAAKTNCFLNSHTLLLGEKAKANSIPSLEILANDVQSRHGATVDHLDEEKVFYLMTRGLNRKESEKTIVDGFMGEVFQKSNGFALKDWEKLLKERMEIANA